MLFVDIRLAIHDSYVSSLIKVKAQVRIRDSS